MIRAFLLGGALLIAAPATTPAWAHAHLRNAIPSVGGMVAVAPDQVSIGFSEAIEPRFSTVEVTDAQGARVDAGVVQVAPGDATRLIVKLRPIGPGVYRVVWRVTSVDTHKTEGAFVFTVRP